MTPRFVFLSYPLCFSSCTALKCPISIHRSCHFDHTGNEATQQRNNMSHTLRIDSLWSIIYWLFHVVSFALCITLIAHMWSEYVFGSWVVDTANALLSLFTTDASNRFDETMRPCINYGDVHIPEHTHTHEKTQICYSILMILTLQFINNAIIWLGSIVLRKDGEQIEINRWVTQ